MKANAVGSVFVYNLRSPNAKTCLSDYFGYLLNDDVNVFLYRSEAIQFKAKQKDTIIKVTNRDETNPKKKKAPISHRK